jgi:hypothetical protein
MHEFYTVSGNDISELKELTIFQTNEDSLFKADNLFSQEDVKNKIDEFYPSGISNHGKQYLENRYHFVYDNRNSPFASYMPLIEMTFELVRQIKFKDKPSRFESFYACETYEEALEYRKDKRNLESKIYKVSTESFFKADMNLLKAPTIIGSVILAEKYWNGESSENPFWEILMKSPVKILHEVK